MSLSFYLGKQAIRIFLMNPNIVVYSAHCSEKLHTGIYCDHEGNATNESMVRLIITLYSDGDLWLGFSSCCRRIQKRHHGLAIGGQNRRL